MSRRREDCSTCTAVLPTLEHNVDEFWKGLPRHERLRTTVGGRISDRLKRLPGYSRLAERRQLRTAACPDCGEIHHDVFMVHDCVWASVGLADDAGWFCLPCFERRLGRRVQESDLCDVPVNDWL